MNNITRYAANLLNLCHLKTYQSDTNRQNIKNPNQSFVHKKGNKEPFLTRGMYAHKKLIKSKELGSRKLAECKEKSFLIQRLSYVS